jgi:hypothetical protein
MAQTANRFGRSVVMATNEPFPASSNELNGSSTIGPSHNWTWGFS